MNRAGSSGGHPADASGGVSRNDSCPPIKRQHPSRVRHAYISGGAPKTCDEYLRESGKFARASQAKADKQEYVKAAHLMGEAIEVLRCAKPYFANEETFFSLLDEQERCFTKAARSMRAYARLSPPQLQAAIANQSDTDSLGGIPHETPKRETNHAASDIGTVTDTRVVTDTGVDWDDIVGLNQVKREFRDAVEQPLLWPKLFEGKDLGPWRGVLLFGPPGTGKTMLAKAAAHGAQCAFFEVRASDILREYVGVSEQRVRALFAEARKAPRALIFIDECDNLMRRRNDRESDAVMRVKTEFFTSMDGLGSGDNIMVVGATNAPADLDDAIVRRFEKRLWVGPPDTSARAAMFKDKLARLSNNRCTEEDYAAFARATEGYTGADITVIFKAAAAQARRRVVDAAYFYRDPSTGHDVPCDAQTAGAFACPADTKSLQVSLHITSQDILDAIRNTPPAVGPSRLKEYHDHFAAALMVGNLNPADQN